MLLFVGLGNPGAKYAGHRHNIGFMAVDLMVRRHNFGPEKTKFQSLVHEGRLGSEKVLILKPQTYMNESGRAVGEAMRFYKLTPADITVFYDELDLAFGKIKVKTGGGAAGHNGIRSMAAHIGPDFQRVRMGIGHPGDKSRVHGHVLGDFAKAEQNTLEDMLSATALEAEWLVRGNAPRFMTEVARRLAPGKSNAAQPTPGRKTMKTNSDGAATNRPDPSNTKQEGPLAEALRALKGD